MANSSLTYPHTTIVSGLREISRNSTRWGTKAKSLLDQYLSKKTFYTERIAELEEAASAAEFEDDSPTLDLDNLPEYPHTSIQQNLDRMGGTLSQLRESLLRSGSPERSARLALLDSLESTLNSVGEDYSKKRHFLDALRSAIEDAS